MSVPATRLVAAAGALVIASAGGYVVASNAHTGVSNAPSQGSVAAPPPNVKQMSLGPNVTYGRPGALHTVRAVQSSANFLPARLTTQVSAAVHAAQARRVSASQPTVSNPGASGWFNPAAFVPQSTPYGTVGRSTVWGPHLQQWDLGFAKRFAIAEKRYFQFRGELFNAFNQVNLKPPASTAGSAGFGTITAALPGRNVQLGLKFYW